MATGKVKWFNNAKGYGFILADEGEEDLFAHFSSIQMDGYKTLKAGQSVGYDLVEGPKGNHAINIREVDQASDGASTDTTQDSHQTMDPNTPTASEAQDGEQGSSGRDSSSSTGESTSAGISEDTTADSIGNH